MAIKHRIRVTASPQSLDELIFDESDPIAAARAKWFRDHLENGFENHLGMFFDPVLTNSRVILYRKNRATEKDAEAVMAWLAHLRAKFKDGMVSRYIPFSKITDKNNIDGQNVYFTVQLGIRGNLTVGTHW